MARQQPAISRWEAPRTRLRLQAMLNIGLVVLGVAFATYFLLAWVLLPSWVHIEVFVTAPGYLLKPGESFFSDFLEHTFNLRIAERGLYRPRFLSFLIEYLDINLSHRIHQEYPQLGIKLPSYGFSIVATVASFVWFWKSLYPKNGYGIALLGGASLLYFDVYMNTSFMVLRGGKFLISAAGLLCMTIFIRHYRRQFSSGNLGSCIAISCVLFLLMTMDEQIVALVIFIAGVALVVGCMQMRVSQALVIFALATAAYPLYFAFWGRWLFAKFTPGGIEESSHYHQFSDVFKLDLTQVSNAVEMLLANMLTLGFASLVLLVVFVLSLARIIGRRHQRFQKLFICAAFTSFPVLLTSIMAASLPDMFLIKQLWTLFYLTLSVHTLIAVVTWSSSLADFRTKWAKIALAIAFLWICATGVYKMDDLHQVACTETNRIINAGHQDLPCGANIFP